MRGGLGRDGAGAGLGAAGFGAGVPPDLFGVSTAYMVRPSIAGGFSICATSATRWRNVSKLATPDFRVPDLAADEAERHLDLVAVFQELARVVDFGLQVVLRQHARSAGPVEYL